MAERLLPRELRVLYGHTTLVLLLLTGGYYALPFRLGDEAVGYVRLVVSLVLLGLLVVVFRMQTRRSRLALSPTHLRVQGLLTTLYVLVLAFALLYALIAAFGTEQFVGIDDRTDALYFSVTLISTVGFGDIHPSGTVAQVAVTVHMLFNLIYLGTALRLLSSGGSRQPEVE